MKKQLEKHKESISWLSGGWFGVTNPWDSSFETLSGTVGKVEDLINFAIGFSALVCVILIVYGGYTLIISAGDPEGVEKGQKLITNAVIGMVITFLAGIIIRFVLLEIIK